jgi:hypothetical protein
VSNIQEADFSHHHFTGRGSARKLGKSRKLARRTKGLERQNVQISKQERNRRCTSSAYVNPA